MKKKKLILIVLGLLIVSVVGLVGYLYFEQYQKVLDERARIIDTHCIAVNPLIIDTKVAYIGSMKSILASDSAAYISAQYSWLGSAKEYIRLERQWLRNADAFLKRSDVQWFSDSQHLEAFRWQRKIYETEYDGMRKIVNAFDRKERISLRNLHERMLNVEQEKNIAQQAYNLRWGQSSPKLDFRNQFIKQPVSQCPPENVEIPNIYDEMQKTGTEYYVPNPQQ